MANLSGSAYALTTLSPIRNAIVPGEEIACADKIKDLIKGWDLLDNSPMATVPQTYLCRFFVLDDVYTESLPGASVRDTLSDLLPFVPDWLRRRTLPREDHLQSRYLVFLSSFHSGPQGDIDPYLHGMWDHAGDAIRSVWTYCHGFEAVRDAASFATYMKKCQRAVSLSFVGANDDPLPEQLKALYLKQEFARFAVENQGLEAAAVRRNYQQFIRRVAPGDLTDPTWPPGKYRP